MTEHHVVIVGGGASGLLLCGALLSQPGLAGARIAVVDDGSLPVQGRSWAYWSRADREVDRLAAARWRRLRINTATTCQELDMAPYEYRLIRGADLWNWVRSLPGAGNVSWHEDSVRSIKTADPGEGCRSAVAVGRLGEYQADWLFDSRPARTPAAGELRLQCLGVTVEAHAPAFDPAVASFMDFRLATPGAVRFGYALPTSATEALVEVAQFTTEPTPPEAMREVLAGYLRNQWGLSSWQVRGGEHGQITLWPRDPREPVGPGRVAANRPPSRVVDIGCRAGLLKASTGFAFERMIRDSLALAESLDRTGAPARPPAHARRHGYLDRVFLRVMAANPSAIEKAIAALFSANPPDRVLRFLDEDGVRWDEARLIASMPKSPFVAAALRRDGR